MKLLVKLFFIITSVFCISCNTENHSIIEDKLNNISDDIVELSKKKFQDLQDAYSNIQAERGF